MSDTPVVVNEASKVASNETAEAKPALKICCACPETRQPRDQCIVEKGQEHCEEFIENHKRCLRSLGFKV